MLTFLVVVYCVTHHWSITEILYMKVPEIFENTIILVSMVKKYEYDDHKVRVR